MMELSEIARIKAELGKAEAAIAAVKMLLEKLDTGPTPGPVQPVLLLSAPVPAVTVPVKEPDPDPVDEPLVINAEWEKVLDILNNGTDNVFVTGEAGTGKSTLLKYFTDEYPGGIAIVAPTGVAALRVGGETIHRFFGFSAAAIEKDDIPTVKDSRRAKYTAVDILVIDEISMVRADLMDAIDKFLRLNGRNPLLAFGGARVVMFGDLFQLPPVAKEKDEKKWLEDRYGTDTPYFFHAEVWRTAPLKTVTLTTIFRQKDQKFTEALNAIRKGQMTDEHLKLINTRVRPTFRPPANDDLWLTLTTTNDSADLQNRKMLSAIKEPSEYFEAAVTGDFDLKNAPTDTLLELKPGAIVMFIRNNKDGLWSNGTLGKVVSTKPLKVETKSGVWEVEQESWEAIAYEFNEETKKLTRYTKGKFTQIPLKLASAITIHKSQGLTFEQVIVDFGFGAFAAGQAYVALSRCRTLEGMVLKRPVQSKDLIISTEVQKFMAGQPVAKPKLAVGMPPIQIQML